MTSLGRSLGWLALCVAVAGCLENDREPFEFRVVDHSELSIIAPQVDFAEIREIVVDGDALWVLDGAPPFLTRIALDGGEVVRFADRGQGPAELSWPVAAQPDGSGGIRVWDRGNRRMLTFDQAGELTDSRPLESSWAPRTRRNIGAITYADPLRVRSLGDHIVTGFFPRGVNRTPDIAQGSLHRATVSLEPLAVPLLRFAEATDPTSENLREFASVPLWDACEGHIVYWNPREAHVSWIDEDQGVTASAGLGTVADALTLGDVRGYLEAMARLEVGPGSTRSDIDFEAMAHAARDQFAKLAPSVVDVRCASDLSAWLQMFGTATDPLGRSTRWLKVDTINGVVGFEFPEGFEPKSATGGGIYGTFTMVDGASRVGRWSPFDSATGN